MGLPKVVLPERIGTSAVERFRSRIPTSSRLTTSFIPRELTGRDLGIDLAAEIIHKGETTGRLLFFQVKGTTEKLVLNKDGSIHYSHPVKNLCYAEQLAVPLILILVYLKTNKFYWLFLQDYIANVLTFEDLKWREKSTKVLKIPIAQSPSKNFDELVELAREASYNRDKQAALSLIVTHRFEVDTLLETVTMFAEGEGRPADYIFPLIDKVNNILRRIENLKMFQDVLYPKGMFIRQNSIVPGIKALHYLQEGLKGTSITKNMLEDCGLNVMKESEFTQDLALWQLGVTIKHNIRSLELYIGTQALPK